MIKRIVIFGTSHSVGHGLADWTINDMDKPSQFSWPSIVSKILDIEVINHSKAGSGIDLMYYDILEYCIKESKQDDLVIVQLPGQMHRFSLITDENEKLKTYRIHGPGYFDGHNKNKNKLLQSFYMLTGDDHWIRNWLGYKSAITSILTLHKINFFGYVCSDSYGSWWETQFKDKKLYDQFELLNSFHKDKWLNESFSNWLDKKYPATKMVCGHYDDAGHAAWAKEIIIPAIKSF